MQAYKRNYWMSGKAIACLSGEEKGANLALVMNHTTKEIVGSLITLAGIAVIVWLMLSL